MSHEALQRPPREPFVPPGGIDLLARDMTAIFSADCTLRAAQDKLAEVGQWLPIDGDPDATLGSLLDQNSTGPLRLGFGGWRDLLLGAQFTNGRGELITAGGRTIKNVAGYDLTKFIVGSFGIFGRLVTITTRTLRTPEAALLVRAHVNAGDVGRLLPTPCRPQWVLNTGEGTLLGYLGDVATMDFYETAIQQYTPTPLLWAKSERQAVADHNELRTRLWSIRPAATGARVRISLPPSRLGEFDQHQDYMLNGWVCDPIFGIVVGETHESPDRLRQHVQNRGGSIRFGTDIDTLDASTNPGERQIIERLKLAFDPDNRLQPLPWQRS